MQLHTSASDSNHNLFSYGSWPMVTPTEQERALLPEMEALHGQKTIFLSPFVHRRREMAHPVLTKGFLQLSPEAAMLSGPQF